jgi:hypothetical protein
VRANAPNAFAERYGYEITGSRYLKEIDGVAVDLPQRTTTASSLWNAILSGTPFGSLMHDWASGTFTGVDGRHLDASIASALNTNASLTGGVHTTLKMTLGKQFQSFLGMLGLGGRNGGFISHGGQNGQGGEERAVNGQRIWLRREQERWWRPVLGVRRRPRPGIHGPRNGPLLRGRL